MTEAVLFLVALFVITWSWGFFVAPPLLTAGSLSMFLIGLLPSVWTPTFVAMALIARRDGINRLWPEVRARFVAPSSGLLVAAIALPIAMVILSIAVARAVGDAAAFVDGSALPVTIGIQVVTGATGEELGWRGYLLPRLRTRLERGMAILVMSGLWAAWHVPAFFVDGMPHRAIPMLPFLAFVACFGVVLGSLFFAAGQSIVPTLVAHLVLNVMLAIGGVAITSLTFWVALDASAGATALVALLVQWRSTLEAEPPVP